MWEQFTAPEPVIVARCKLCGHIRGRLCVSDTSNVDAAILTAYWDDKRAHRDPCECGTVPEIESLRADIKIALSRPVLNDGLRPEWKVRVA